MNGRRLDFDTRKDSARDRSARGFHPVFNPSATEQGPLESDSKDGTFTVPPGSRKAVLVHLAREAWRAGLLDPKALARSEAEMLTKPARKVRSTAPPWVRSSTSSARSSRAGA
jgi:hypothetical protein